LEIHVPAEFTAARPAVRFSHTDFKMKTADHHLACKLPQSTEHPSLQAGATEFKMFGARTGAPSTLYDYLYSDEPQISMHITTFIDTTLISFQFPHTLTDAMGMSSLMSGISLVLAGRIEEIPALPEPTNDPMMDICLASDTRFTEPYNLANRRISGFSSVRFGLNMTWDTFQRPNMINRTTFLPARVMKLLRARAESELFHCDIDNKPSFITNGDILTAWGSLMILSSEPRQRPAIILNVLNLRGRLPSIFKAQGMYVQNLAFNSNTLLSVQDVLNASVGFIAGMVRKSLMEQSTQSQLHAIVRESHTAYNSTGNPPLFGEPNALLIVVSNWDKAKLFDAVNFSPAVVQDSSRSHHGGPTPGKLVYHHAHNSKEARSTRNFWNIVGKDMDGNYWVGGYLLPETWKMIEEEIANLDA
jgi:hypothetical protein